MGEEGAGLQQMSLCNEHTGSIHCVSSTCSSSLSCHLIPKPRNLSVVITTRRSYLAEKQVSTGLAGDALQEETEMKRPFWGFEFIKVVTLMAE